MNAETKICQNCKTQFQIEPEDFAFYERIKVPAPTWCHECRNWRRMTWREDHTLYKTTCALCGRTTVSAYPKDSMFTIYCRDCWISDKWDRLQYGREYDFSQPFFVQYRKLMESVPRPALTGNNMVNSEYSHAGFSCKNCFLVFWSYYAEDCQYSYALLFSKFTFDSWIVDNSDHVYESLHCDRLYNTKFLYYSDDCLDSSFLYDCVGLTNCFGCVNIRKSKYMIFNQQYSKEEYQKQMAYWDLGSYAKLEEAKTLFHELILKTPHRYAHITNAQNVTGDIIRDTKNCKVCFSTLDGVQDCKYIYLGGLNLKDSYDVSGSGDMAELLYEVVGGNRLQNCHFSAGGSNARNLMYCDWPFNSSDIFGCIDLRNKKYCILNKQYTKEEYEVLLPKIVAHMDEMPYRDKKGRVYKFGEFFPPELSAFAYNETLAFGWYPRTEEQVLAEGLSWRDPVGRDYEISIRSDDLPDHIRDVQDGIVQETIECKHKEQCNHQCTKAFRIRQSELDFYRNMNVALPRLCPNCRHMERIAWRNGFKLYHRTCAKCDNTFETTYAPDRPEIIYCDRCYKEEFL